jgi:hypothetical protein
VLGKAHRRYLAFELIFAALLVGVTLLLRHHGGALHVAAVVSLGYAVALVAHVIAVLFGWGRPGRS